MLIYTHTYIARFIVDKNIIFFPGNITEVNVKCIATPIFMLRKRTRKQPI